MPQLPRISAPEAVLRAARFPDERCRVPEAWEGCILDLVGREHLARVHKRGTPAFSPVVYRAGAARGKRGIAEATALVLDFDHLPSATAAEVWKRLDERGWAWVAYSSFSHLADGEEDHCFRLIVLVSRPILPDEYDAVWLAADTALGGFADRNARDVSRIWFVASCPPERVASAWVRWSDGRPLDVGNAVAAYQQQRQRQRRKARKNDLADAPIPSGGRNAALMSLAGAMRRRGADGEAILEGLRATNAARCEPPLDDAEVRRIVHSVVRYNPTSVLITANRTDLGNAERFEAFAGDRFRFVHNWGSWLWFDGTRWQRDVDGESVRAGRDTLRATAAEAGTVPDQDERDQLAKHALDSESSARIGAMLSLAQSLLPVAPEALDADPDLFNCANGTIDLRTGELRPHDRADLLTRRSPVAFDPDATCPLWESFLARVLGGSASLVAFLQRAIGYSLTGHTSEQVLLLLYGIGANGKSTFLETVRSLLGDYATQADFTTFLKRDNDGARNDLARLVGTRFVSAVEAEAGKPLAEALVKQLTGGDTITARFLFREFFDFKPAFKLWLAANHKPTITGGDHGIWRRMRLVPFTVTIPEAERDPKLTAKLAEELPGILAWAVRGCLAWRAEGLGLPPEVKAATASYRDEMDVLGPFLDEATVAAEGCRITARELYEAYEKWCAANGERAKSQKGFAMSLRERGFEAVKGTKGVRCWAGLGLRPEGDPGGGWRMGGGFPEKVPSGNPTTLVTNVDARIAIQETTSPDQAPPIRHPPPATGTTTASLAVEEGEL